MVNKIKKRDGRKVKFDQDKILRVLQRVINSIHPDDTLSSDELQMAKNLTRDVINRINDEFNDDSVPKVEEIQDIVQGVLISAGMTHEAKNFIEYRQQRTAEREYNSDLTKTYRKMLTSKAQDMDLMRENANIDGNSVMGTMLRIGSEANKNFIDKYILKPEYSFAHSNGDFHIHDKDFYELTSNCLFVPVGKLLKDGFNTGHGFIRQPQGIQSAASLCAICIQSEQNDQFGGVGVATFDWDLAPYVAKSYANNILSLIDSYADIGDEERKVRKNEFSSLYDKHNTLFNDEAQKEIGQMIFYYLQDENLTKKVLEKARKRTERDVFQGMEALIHNLNSMHSRCLPADEEVVTLNLKKTRDLDKMSDAEKEALKDLITNLYKEKTMAEVGQELGLSKRQIARVFDRLGITKRTKEETAVLMRERYIKEIGCPSKSCLKEVQAKVRKTQFERYGCYAFNTEKQKQTNIERYGFENPMKNDEVRQKVKETNLKRYGSKCSLQNDEVKEKARKTCLKEYGAENVFSSNSSLKCRGHFTPKSEIKAHETLKERYGGSGAGSLEIKSKISKTCLEKYGTITYPFYEHAVNIHISKGQQEIADFLEDTFTDLTVIVNKRGLLNENKCLEIDIWIPEIRLGIEYNGEYWHNRNDYEKDIICDTISSRERIKDMLCLDNNITLLQIWESDYKSDREGVLEFITNKVKELKEVK